MKNRTEARRLLAYTIVAVAVVALLMGAMAWNAGGTTWMGGWGGMMMGGMGLMMLVPILLVVLLIQTLSPNAQAPDDDAQSILERRYARGDVSREEYLRMKDDLGRRP